MFSLWGETLLTGLCGLCLSYLYIPIYLLSLSSSVLSLLYPHQLSIVHRLSTFVHVTPSFGFCSLYVKTSMDNLVRRNYRINGGLYLRDIDRSELKWIALFCLSGPDQHFGNLPSRLLLQSGLTAHQRTAPTTVRLSAMR